MLARRLDFFKFVLFKHFQMTTLIASCTDHKPRQPVPMGDLLGFDAG